MPALAYQSNIEKNSMNKTPLIITLFLCLSAVAAVVVISISNLFTLNDAELVNAYIAVAACFGAFISATFIVFSYLQKNKTYIE